MSMHLAWIKKFNREQNEFISNLGNTKLNVRAIYTHIKGSHVLQSLHISNKVQQAAIKKNGRVFWNNIFLSRTLRAKGEKSYRRIRTQ